MSVGVDDGDGGAGRAGRRIRRRFQPRHRPRLVDEIDGAVGQAVVAQMPRRELRRGFERRVGVGHAVVFFVAAAQPGENLHRLLDRRLVDGDLLQPPRERAILFDVLELLEGRRADHAQLAGREQRLQQRREIHRAAGDRAGADGRVDFVDEEDRLRPRAEGGDDRLEALLEIAAEARAGEQRAGVEREDLSALQRLLDIVGQQPRGQPFGHRGLADAGLADEDRIVLAPPAEDFDGALQFLGAPDERIELALAGASRQVDAVGGERIFRGGRAFAAAAGRAARAWRRSGVAAPGVFEMPCEMYSRMSRRVMPCSASRLAA